MLGEGVSFSSLISFPCSSKWLYTNVHANNNIHNNIQCVQKNSKRISKEKELVGEKKVDFIRQKEAKRQ